MPEDHESPLALELGDLLWELFASAGLVRVASLRRIGLVLHSLSLLSGELVSSHRAKARGRHQIDPAVLLHLTIYFFLEKVNLHLLSLGARSVS